jgi:hypothetical protein
MKSEPIFLPVSPQVIKWPEASLPSSMSGVHSLDAEPAAVSVAPTGNHECGPNCPQHRFSITRNPTAGGIDILA